MRRPIRWLIVLGSLAPVAVMAFAPHPAGEASRDTCCRGSIDSSVGLRIIGPWVSTDEMRATSRRWSARRQTGSHPVTPPAEGVDRHRAPAQIVRQPAARAQSSERDVAAELDAGPGDLLDGPIGAGSCLLHGVSKTNDVEHSTTVDEELLSFFRRSGVKDDHILS